MKTLELFCCLVQLDLCGLRLCNFLLQFIGFAGYFNGEFFYLQSKLFDLSLIRTSVLLQSQVILLLLSGSESPLLKFLLVPIHFKFELVHALIRFEDHVLDVVEAVLLVSNPLLQLFYLVL